MIGFVIYGVSLMSMFLASTLYHAAINPKKRKTLNVYDHAAIFVLIAGTYTPFTLLGLPRDIGMILFITSWSIAIIGVVLKVFFTGRFKIFSTLLYVLMGWQIIFAYEPLRDTITDQCFMYLMYGGVCYTIGAVLYSIKKLSYNHAIFHVFVLFGASFHFRSVLLL